MQYMDKETKLSYDESKLSYDELFRVLEEECSRIDNLDKRQVLTDKRIVEMKDEITKLIDAIYNNKVMVQGQYRILVESNQSLLNSLIALNDRIDRYVDKRDDVGIFQVIKKEVSQEVNKKTSKIEKMETDIYGNGKKGLKTEMAKLSEKTNMMVWLIGILLSTTTLSLASILGYFIMKIIGVA